MIRRYSSDDFRSVLHLFELNSPRYFDPSEKKDLSTYLKEELEDYFVYEQDSHILGAGGINYSHTEGHAIISWDMIHP